MKNILKRSLALLLTLCFVIGCTAMGAVAQAETQAAEEPLTYVVEAETASYTAKLEDGSNWTATKTLDGTYYVEGTTGPSCTAILFQNKLGDTIDYKISVEKAGKYVFNFAYRSHNSTYSNVSLSVNGKAPSFVENVSMKASASNGGIKNSPNDSKNNFQDLDCGYVWLDEGENTITVKQTGVGSKNPAIIIDKFTFVYANQLQFEAEDTPFVATDCNGDVVNTSKEKETWAWNLASNKSGISGEISYNIAFFHSGGVGGKIDYTVNVPAEGEYGIVINNRPHEKAYCVFRVLVNGEQVGGDVSNKNADFFNGTENKASVMKAMNVGNAMFKAGDNTVTIEIVANNPNADLQISGYSSAFVLDYIRLVEPSEIEPEYTVAVKDIAVDESNAYQQFRKNADDGTKNDIRIVMLVPAADIAEKDSIIANVEFSDGRKLENYEATTVYNTIDAVSDDWTDRYNAPEGYVIFGVVITGAPADVTVENVSWNVQ